jgi:UDP:flavonoid glycosyltransferase YjiC (YdhE family)
VQLKPKRLEAERLRDAVRAALGMRDRAGLVASRLDPAGAPARFADAAESLLNGTLRREAATSA